MPKRLRTFNGLDGEKVSALFSDSLRDIKNGNPGHCPVCLGGCLRAFCHSSSLGSYISPENIAILREHHHTLLDSCMLFLTLERPLDEINGFGGNSSSWIACRCDFNNPLIRELHMDTPPMPPIDFFVDRLVCIVYSCLQPLGEKGSPSVHKVERNREKAALSGKYVLWPTRPHDLLPFEPGSSIRALGNWMTRFPTPLMIGLLASMLNICKRSMLPALIDSAVIPEIVIQMSQAPFKVWSENRQQPLKMRIQIATACLADAGHCAAFFHRLLSTTDQHELAKFCSGRVDSIFRAVQMSLDNVSNLASQVNTPDATGDAPWIETCYLSIGSSIHNHLALSFSGYDSRIIHASLSRLKERHDVKYMAYELLMLLAHHERCFSPGCRETYFGAARKFSFCGRCARVPFCSKECLARAWNYPKIPHKLVCEKLKLIGTTMKIPSRPEPQDRPEFESRLQKAGIADSVLADVVSHLGKLVRETSTAFDRTTLATNHLVG